METFCLEVWVMLHTRVSWLDRQELHFYIALDLVVGCASLFTEPGCCYEWSCYQMNLGECCRKQGGRKVSRTRQQPLGIFAQKFSPCLAFVVVSSVFLFYSEFIEGFAGRVPSAITFKTATCSVVAVRKATLWKWHGGTQSRISSLLSLLFLCNENLNLICNFLTPFYNASAPHPHWDCLSSSLEVPGKASGPSHLPCGIHFFPAFFSKEKLISLTQRKGKCIW